MAGTVMVDERTILFTVVGDANGVVSIWAYLDLTPNEVEDLRGLEFDTDEELRDFVASKFSHRRAVLALAHDLSLREWSPVDLGEDLLESAVKFVQDVVRSHTPSDDQNMKLQASLAAADVVIPQDLVQA
ncbi:hypothetical protein AB0O34_29295 [Sphaerisporangium sp. NPDC088356]|uniref:hypothetical protein n=1 Tax=Sphaerisporangium sp. NPDC088356 TaxID=3154871 RepID=UPI00343F2087